MEDNRFRQWLRMVRAFKGQLQTEAARDLKVTSPTYCKWETGSVQPGWKYMQKIALWGSAVGAPSAGDLMDWTELKPQLSILVS